MFLGGGPALLCVFRACFVSACVVGSHPWALAFLCVFMVVLFMFCECFVNQSEFE